MATFASTYNFQFEDTPKTYYTPSTPYNGNKQAINSWLNEQDFYNNACYNGVPETPQTPSNRNTQIHCNSAGNYNFTPKSTVRKDSQQLKIIPWNILSEQDYSSVKSQHAVLTPGKTPTSANQLKSPFQPSEDFIIHSPSPIRRSNLPTSFDSELNSSSQGNRPYIRPMRLFDQRSNLNAYTPNQESGSYIFNGFPTPQSFNSPYISQKIESQFKRPNPTTTDDYFNGSTPSKRKKTLKSANTFTGQERSHVKNVSLNDPSILDNELNYLERLTPIQYTPIQPTNRKLAADLKNAKSQDRNSCRCTFVDPVSGAACNTLFSRSYDLIRHHLTKHAQNKIVFKCNQCPELKTFSRYDALTRHKRVKHGASRCSIG